MSALLIFIPDRALCSLYSLMVKFYTTFSEPAG